MRVVKRDGTIGTPTPLPNQCPPHRYTYVKRVNGVQEGPPLCCNCMKTWREIGADAALDQVLTGRVDAPSMRFPSAELASSPTNT